MPMILELTENHMTQEYFEKGKLHDPFMTMRGTRGLVKEAGFASGMPGIEDGTEVAVLQIIKNATFEYIMVPLSKLRIVYDRKPKNG